MNDTGSYFPSLSDMLVPVHRDGHKFIAMGLIIALIMFALISTTLGWIALAATLWLVFFFRDPDRVTPLREGLVVAPADGTIVSVEQAVPPQELGFGPGERTRISIHISVLDVHVNRSPVNGRVVRSLYVPGAFANPTLDKASEENERRALVITLENGDELAVVQIAGVITRRIVTFAGEGDTLRVGQRFGLIRFGSRVDVYLPAGHPAHMATGQRAIAGETVLADLASDEPAREMRKG